MKVWGQGLLGRENHRSKALPRATPEASNQPLVPAEPSSMSLPQSGELTRELRGPQPAWGVSGGYPRWGCHLGRCEEQTGGVANCGWGG